MKNLKETLKTIGGVVLCIFIIWFFLSLARLNWLSEHGTPEWEVIAEGKLERVEYIENLFDSSTVLYFKSGRTVLVYDKHLLMPSKNIKLYKNIGDGSERYKVEDIKGIGYSDRATYITTPNKDDKLPLIMFENEVYGLMEEKENTFVFVKDKEE